MTFGRALWPPEANVIAGTPGRGISLARRADVLSDATAALAAQHANDAYLRPPPAGRGDAGAGRAALARWRYRRLM
jgi:hypothetical protein